MVYYIVSSFLLLTVTLNIRTVKIIDTYCTKQLRNLIQTTNMCTKQLFSIIFILISVNLCASYKILVVMPHPGHSHFMVFENLFIELSKRGHELTVISHFPLKNPIPNYRDVSLRDAGVTFGGGNAIPLDLLTGYRHEKYAGPLLLYYLNSITTEGGLKSENLRKFLNEQHQFDVVLGELFNSNSFLGLAKKFNAPLIGLSSCYQMPWSNVWFAQPDHPAYIPTTFMDYSDEMSFFERVEGSVVLVLNKLFYEIFIEKPGNELSKKYINVDVLEPENMFYNISLMLVNTHFTLNRPKPFVPNVIEVGGMHIRKPKQLPSNIEKWINESSEGVIYFSLGSLIKGHTFPEDKRRAFLKAFGRSSHRVLWKWENETMAGKPDNVMIQKWMPQFDILCHPNVKAFISHGGLLGTTEAVHCGVPVIVMPQFGDQHTNARALESSGGGIILHLNDATEETVYKALKKVLSPDSRQKAKELSERFRDRPMPPLETAIYWVEYVARHRGAPHMRTAAVGMPFWKYYLIDVISFLLAIASISLYIFYIIVKSLISRLTKTTKEKTS